MSLNVTCDIILMTSRLYAAFLHYLTYGCRECPSSCVSAHPLPYLGLLGKVESGKWNFSQILRLGAQIEFVYIERGGHFRVQQIA